jgi:hypothetical protein
MHYWLMLSVARRWALVGVALGLLVGTHTQAQPRYTVSAGQLQQVAAQRFPMRYPVAGLLNLDVQAPLLRLLPEHNRLSAEMAVDAAGPVLAGKQKGSLEVDFALRYEASDRSIRAHKLRFRQLRIAGLEPAAAELLNVYGPAMAEQSLQEVVLHQLRPQDLAVADGLGMQPGSITVTDSGLVIGFEVKPLK